MSRLAHSVTPSLTRPGRDGHAPDGTDAAVAAVVAAHEALVDTLDGTRARRELMEYDLEVHRTIYRAAGNHHLQESLIRLDNLATRIWCMVLDRLPAVEEHILEHRRLIQAILNGDADRAAQLAADHVSHFESMVRAAL